MVHLLTSITEANAEAVALPIILEDRCWSRSSTPDSSKPKNNKIDSSTTPMLMTRMTKMMSDILADNNTQTQRQITHINSQLHTVATTTDFNISNMHTQHATMKEQHATLSRIARPPAGPGGRAGLPPARFARGRCLGAGVLQGARRSGAATLPRTGSGAQRPPGRLSPQQFHPP